MPAPARTAAQPRIIWRHATNRRSNSATTMANANMASNTNSVARWVAAAKAMNRTRAWLSNRRRDQQDQHSCHDDPDATEGFHIGTAVNTKTCLRSALQAWSGQRADLIASNPITPLPSDVVRLPR